MPTFFEWYDIFIINVKFVLKRENPLREKLVKMSTVFFELIIISTKENLKRLLLELYRLGCYTLYGGIMKRTNLFSLRLV